MRWLSPSPATAGALMSTTATAGMSTPAATRTSTAATTGMRHRPAFAPATIVIMHIASPVITAAKKIHIRLRRHYHPAIPSATVHVTHTARQGRQQCKHQPNFDPVNQNIRLVHTDLPFLEEIKKRGCIRNTARRAAIKTPNINSISCLSFMGNKITMESRRRHGVFTPPVASQPVACRVTTSPSKLERSWKFYVACRVRPKDFYAAPQVPEEEFKTTMRELTT